ncbi:MAG: sulfur carrier protein ThiS [Acidimicrobiia bacterium]|nr:sulfur carrier protein ThiS [Acidimicrobiia bacterium]
MIVTVNGVRREVEEGLSVAALVDDLAGGTRGTAVAVNQEVVPRSTWASTRLQPGDAVELLRAAQGG